MTLLERDLEIQFVTPLGAERVALMFPRPVPRGAPAWCRPDETQRRRRSVARSSWRGRPERMKPLVRSNTDEASPSLARVIEGLQNETGSCRDPEFPARALRTLLLALWSGSLFAADASFRSRPGQSRSPAVQPTPHRRQLGGVGQRRNAVQPMLDGTARPPFSVYIRRY